MGFARGIRCSERCLAFALLIGLSSCTISTAAYPVFEKGGIEARGADTQGVFRQAPHGDETFSVLGTNLFARRNSVIPGFCIQLTPSAAPTPIDALTAEFVSRWLTRWVPTAADRARGVSERLYPEQEVFAGSSCVLAFDTRDGKLRWITVGEVDPSALPSASVGPRIGPRSCDHLYALPLSRAQLVEVFGEPEWEGWRRGPENLLILF